MGLMAELLHGYSSPYVITTRKYYGNAMFGHELQWKHVFVVRVDM